MVKKTEPTSAGHSSAEVFMNSGTAFPEAAHSEEPAAAAPPSFADFALGVYPFLELQPFHRT